MALPAARRLYTWLTQACSQVYFLDCCRGIEPRRGGSDGSHSRQVVDVLHRGPLRHDQRTEPTASPPRQGEGEEREGQ